MEDWVLFVFKRANSHYLVKAGCEEEAWKFLQRRLSWNNEIIKKECKLVHILNSMSDNIIVLK